MIVPWVCSGYRSKSFCKGYGNFKYSWGAAGIVNFVVLVAALSAMNSQLYTSTRMMFSLSRAGYAQRYLEN